MLSVAFLFLWVGLFVVTTELIAQERELVLNETSIKEYADQLYERGEYYRSVTENLRLLHYFSQSPLAEGAKIDVARAYLAGGKPQEAIDWLQAFEPSSSNGMKERLILLGLAHFSVDAASPFAMRKKRIDQGLAALAEVKENPRIQRFLEEVKLMDEMEDPHSPILAGSLSALLPGAGSLYVGRPMEALYAFFMTGLFGMAAKESYDQERPDLGASFGFFALVFYGANVYSAVNGAHKGNGLAREKVFIQVRQKEGIFFHPSGILFQRRF